MSSVLLTQWARLLIDSLVQSGIRDAVISPGSRSTPFAWAALQHHRLTCHSAIDERCAGFFALGQAKLCGRPSLVIATSGSAAAHYFPAIIEAAYSRTPLLVLSADRPAELLYRGAPQTIDQLGLFGSKVRGSFNLPVPEASQNVLLALQASAAQAVQLSEQPEPGPVHLNAPARKPLEPGAATTAAEQELEERVAHLIARGPTRFAPPALQSPGLGAAALLREIADAASGVIVCGALPPERVGAHEAIRELGLLTGFPIFAEAPSQFVLGAPTEQVLTGFDSFLETAAFGELAPQLIIELGTPLTSRTWSRYRERLHQTRRHVVSLHGWPDAAASAAWMHRADPAEFCARLCHELSRSPNPPGHLAQARKCWLEACVNARDQTLRAAREVLSSLAFGEAHAVHQVCASLPEGSLFVIGNSLPLRAVDQFAAARPASIVTLVQRGANGIDGLVSGAVGVASKALAPTTLLLGDVSLAHDVGGLSLARELTRSLVIVVIDNAGGRIFDELPWGSAANAPDSVRRYWLTPPQIDFEALARAYAIEHAEVTNAATLAAALGRAYQRNGATLISVRVPPHSYHEARLELRAKCAERLHAEPRAK